jgi:hypothetical protein
VALAHLRRGRRESRRREALRDVPAVDSPAGPDRDDVLLRRRLLGCFDRLPEERRVAVVLHLVHGLTVAVRRSDGMPDADPSNDNASTTVAVAARPAPLDDRPSASILYAGIAVAVLLAVAAAVLMAWRRKRQRPEA